MCTCHVTQKQPAAVKDAARMSRHIDAHAHTLTRPHTLTHAHTRSPHTKPTQAQEMVAAATKGKKGMKRVWCGG